MKPRVQYNHFRGTAAADISDHLELKKFLEYHNIDTERFFPVGVEFFIGEEDFFTSSIICNDKSAGGEVVKINFDKKIVSMEEFYKYFKRFNVIVSNLGDNADQIEVKKQFFVTEGGNLKEQ